MALLHLHTQSCRHAQRNHLYTGYKTGCCAPFPPSCRSLQAQAKEWESLIFQPTGPHLQLLWRHMQKPTIALYRCV